MGWRNISTIIDGQLYLGNLQAARSSRSLAEKQITAILSVCTDEIPAEAPQSGIRHMRIAVEDRDNANLLIHLPTACQFIHQALRERKVVLVHCCQGLSRSAAVIAAYLMWSRRINVAQAQTVVRAAREQVWINAGFIEQLVLFEVCNYNPNASDGVYLKWLTQLKKH